MAKSSKTDKDAGSDLLLFQGGTLDRNVVHRQFAEVKNRWLAELEEENLIRRDAGNAIAQIGMSEDKPGDEAAISKLQKISEKIAQRKLPAGLKLGELPGVWGNYTLKFTPPYTGLGSYSVGQKSSVTGSPKVEASGIDNLGQMTCSVDTDLKKPSGGTASNLMGIHFKPMFSTATARISFNSQIAFSWYVNSIKNKVANTSAQGLIQLYQYDTSFVQPSLRRGAFIGWNITVQNRLNFNFVDETGPTWTLEAPVSSAHFYFVVFSLTCSASGSGWPGSLAGARTIVTVPSITVNIESSPVAQA